jgi:hypothetical protein
MSASGPVDRRASTRDVAIYFREDCRTLRDSLQLEMVVAQYCLRMRDVVTAAGVGVGDLLGVAVVGELEHEGDPLSHAILRGLAHLGIGETAKQSAHAASRLAEREVGLPEQFADVGKARARGAYRTSTEPTGEYVLFADLEHPSGRGHSVALFVEPRGGGVVKHIGLLGPMSDLEPDAPFHPQALETVDDASAGTLMSEVLERAHGPQAAETDDFRVLIAAARARSMVLTARAGSAEPDYSVERPASSNAAARSR